MTSLKDKFILPKIDGAIFWLVGGIVRNYFLGVDIDNCDLDFICETKMSYEELAEKLSSYGKVDTVGKSFLVIKFRPHNSDIVIDITLPRTEHSTGIKHTEFQVQRATIEEDLKRRDFTINAVAIGYHDNKIIILDPCNGLQDINNKVLKQCHDNSIAEDYLRALRTFRFAVLFDLSIDNILSENIWLFKSNINTISPERIMGEITKTLNNKLSNEQVCRYLALLMPILNITEVQRMYNYDQQSKYHCYTLGGHTMECVRYTKSTDIVPILATLFHDIGKPEVQTIDNEEQAHYYGHAKVSSRIAHKILTNLTFDNKIISSICKLIKFHMTRITTMKQLRRLVVNNDMSREEIEYLASLQYGDLMALNWELILPMGTTPDDYYNQLQILINELFDNKSSKEVFRLAINGNDLIAVGYKQGKIIGKILKYLTNKVLNEKLYNDKCILLNHILLTNL